MRTNLNVFVLFFEPFIIDCNYNLQKPCFIKPVNEITLHAQTKQKFIQWTGENYVELKNHLKNNIVFKFDSYTKVSQVDSFIMEIDVNKFYYKEDSDDDSLCGNLIEECYDFLISKGDFVEFVINIESKFLLDAFKDMKNFLKLFFEIKYECIHYYFLTSQEHCTVGIKSLIAIYLLEKLLEH